MNRFLEGLDNPLVFSFAVTLVVISMGTLLLMGARKVGLF